MKNKIYSILVGLVAIIIGVIIILYPFLIGLLLGIFLIFFGILELHKRKSRKITILAIIFILSGYFIYAYLGYPEDRFSYPQIPDIRPSDRILVVAPHPDDEALGCAGIIRRAVKNNIPVRVVLMTNGDGYKTNVELYLKTITTKSRDFQKMGTIRHFETIDAMRRLELNSSNISFLSYPDGGLQYLFDNNWDYDKLHRGINGADHAPYPFSYQKDAPYCGANVDKNLEEIINEFKPTIILYPDPGDDHPDHWATHAFVEYTLTKMNYRCKKYTYLVHKGVEWPFPWVFAPGRYLLPPQELLGLSGKWMIFHLIGNEEFLKGYAIREYNSQKIVLDPILESFVRKDELFAIYPDITVYPTDKKPDFFAKDGMPKASFKDVTLNNLVTTGLAYNEKNAWIVLETKNRMKKDASYKFHMRIFRGEKVERIDIKVKDERAVSEVVAKNSIKINENIEVESKGNRMVIQIPSSLFEDANDVMLSVDILDGEMADRADWFKFELVK